MKKFLFLTIALIASAVVMNAQDFLTKHSGEDIQVIVKEVNADDVRYVLFSEPNGVVYTMPKSEILMIRYASGRNEVFSASKPRKANVNDVQFAASANIRPGMKYKELQKIYDPKEYSSMAYERYSPVWSGVGSFFISGLGQMCCGEFGRGLGFLGCNILLNVAGISSLAFDASGITYLLCSAANLGVGIVSIIDAVQVAKVKNMYETDLRSLQSSVSVDLYPSLNAVPMQGGFGVAPGMTLSLTF